MHTRTVLLLFPLLLALGLTALISHLLHVDESINSVILLIGLVTKNAILLVDFANQERARGTELLDALRRAGLAAERARVLDVAVGTGLLARAAHDILGDRGRITGIDPSAGMLAEAPAALPITLVQGIAERLPFASA